MIASALPYPLEGNPSATNELNFPPLPKFDTSPVPSYTSLPSNSLTRDTSRTPSLKSMLLWIDIPQNDPKTVNEIQKRHPTLEVIFKSTYKDAEEYLINNLPEIEEHEIFITICRGYFAQEKKSFTHVAQLFENLNLGTRPLAVYTRSKTDLLKYTSDLPMGVEIFDKQLDLLDFVNDCLKPKS
ncbi:unnamed protein product [Rotaria sp. Silwood2]|nr:unnamed protein product [Rotaria sp. Silwood2]